MSLDREFLQCTIKGLIDTDDFTKRCWDLYDEVYNKERRPRIHLALSRNDYMLNMDQKDPSKEPVPKLIESNMVANQSGTQCSVNVWHEYMMRTHFKQDLTPLFVGRREERNSPSGYIAAMIAVARRLYERTYDSKDTWVLIVSDPGKWSSFDESLVEIELLDTDEKIKVMRRSFAELAKSIDAGQVEENGKLLVEGVEIAVVYMRTGMSGDDYDWAAGDWEKVRRPIELSNAVKSPCIAHQLVDSKRCQQVICSKNNMEEYGLTGEEASKVRECCVEMLRADGNSIKLALTDPSNYVLKSVATEGSSYCMEGVDMVTELERLRNKPGEERHKLLIMQKIRSPSFPNVTCAGQFGNRDSKGRQVKICPEIGIFNGLLMVDGELVKNESLGYLMRSRINEKTELANELFLDSAYFY